MLEGSQQKMSFFISQSPISSIIGTYQLLAKQIKKKQMESDPRAILHEEKWLF